MRRPDLKHSIPAIPMPAHVLSEKFLNANVLPTVFMIEGKRLVAGEAILSGVATIDRTEDGGRSKVGPTDTTVEALVHQHSRMVYRIAYAVLRRHHDAEDATQETFVRVLRYSAKLREVDDPKTWLARIAWRVAVDRTKQRGWSREVSIDDAEKPVTEIAATDAAADTTLEGAQLGSLLEKLIVTLPDKLRAPLILSTMEEMSPREVGATLGINEAAVRSRVFRARQILKEKLAQRAERR